MLLKSTGFIALVFCAVPAQAQQTPLERGAYLMKGPVACGHCHTNTTPGAPELGGGARFAALAYTAISANLTPDPETGITNWSDAELINGIRNGKRPRGSTIGPPMPITSYRGMSDDDVKAIVAYIRSVKPVVNKTARSGYRIQLPESYGLTVANVAAVSDADPVKYGDYVANALAACMDCHSKPGEGGAPDMVNGIGGGGRELRGPWGQAMAPNITPSGIGHYSDADLKKVIMTGERPDGSKLKGPMPVAYYANMSEKDVSAVIAYLKSLPKK